MAGKTHTTAAVLIPPESLLEPIQGIRREHDRQIRRWMPHITLLYPFRPWDAFDMIVAPLAEACAGIEPFEVVLGRFSCFEHSPARFTVWLAAEPAEFVHRLHQALWRRMPDCDDVRQFPGGFTPHLSLGQAWDRSDAEALIASLRARWRPLAFIARKVALIYRFDPPDDVFRVDRTLSLAGGGRS